MGGTLSGILGASYSPRGSDLLSVTINRSVGGKLIVKGLMEDDGAVQIGEARPGVSYTAGLYGNISINLNTNTMGEAVLKILESHSDNQFLSYWYKSLRAGLIDPATISVNTATGGHMLFKAVPVGYARITPASSEDTGREWTFIGASVSMDNLVGFNVAGFGASVALGV